MWLRESQVLVETKDGAHFCFILPVVEVDTLVSYCNLNKLLYI